MTSLLRQPLVQFLLGGAILFLLLLWVEPADEGGDTTIVVTEDALLTYLQFQDKAFDETQATQLLASLDAEAKQRLVEEFVRDEVMVREAIGLGLDQNDDVIRQRLIQKMDFLFQGFAGDAFTPSEAELAEYYSSNQDRYQLPAQATFTHIFFNVRDRTREIARSEASTLLADLNASQVPFEAAGRYGDRFFFLRNYVDRSRQLIEDHFGAEMTSEIFASSPDGGWTGPFSSRYGEHLVLLRARTPARALSLEEARESVLEDLLRDRQNAARRDALAERAKNYSVVIQLDSAP